MRDIVVGALFLGLGLVLSVMTLLVVVSPLSGVDADGAFAFAITLALIDLFLLFWGGFLLLVEPEPDEVDIARIERLFGANVNN